MIFDDKVKYVAEGDRRLLVEQLNACSPDDDSQQVASDLEKIRRFCSFHRLGLQDVCVKRFGAKAAARDMLPWMGQCLLTGFAKSHAGGNSNDLTLLSAALNVADAIDWSEKIADDYKAQVHTTLSEFEKDLIQRVSNPEDALSQYREAEDEHGFLSSEFSHWRQVIPGKHNVIMICPSPYSHYSLFLAEAYCRLGVNIQAIVIRRFSLDRFFNEFRRDGRRLIRKIWRKLVLRANENPDKALISGMSVVRDIQCRYKSVVEMANARSIPVLKINDLNDDFTFESVQQLKPDIISFTGGGIIPQRLIDIAGVGIVNVHLGLLPKYRGMDVVQWPLLATDFGNVGACAHLMSEAVDAGDTIQSVRVNPTGFSSLGSLRNALSGVVPILQLDSVLRVLAGKLQPVQQPTIEPLNYIMNPALESIIDRCILSRNQHGKDGNEALLRIYENAVAVLNCVDT